MMGYYWMWRMVTMDREEWVTLVYGSYVPILGALVTLYGANGYCCFLWCFYTSVWLDHTISSFYLVYGSYVPILGALVTLLKADGYWCCFWWCFYTSVWLDHPISSTYLVWDKIWITHKSTTYILQANTWVPKALFWKGSLFQGLGPCRDLFTFGVPIYISGSLFQCFG